MSDLVARTAREELIEAGMTPLWVSQQSWGTERTHQLSRAGSEAALDAFLAHPRLLACLIEAGRVERCRVKSENMVTHVHVTVVPDADGKLFREVGGSSE